MHGKSKPRIAVLVTLDTKESEGYYLKERIQANGGEAILVDLSMRKYVPKLGRPDIDNDSVARAAGSSIDEVDKLDRAKAQEVMVRGAVKLLREMASRGEIDGAVGLGGSTGLSLVASIMRELPMFMPKFAVTTVITEAGSIIAGSDIIPVWSICDLAGGERVNVIEAEVLNRVAAAVVKAASPAPLEEVERRPTVFATQFGNTTPHIIVAKDVLAREGYDLIAFHALGRTGGYTMERLLEAKTAVGVLDVTTHELVDEVAGGVLVASLEGKLRLKTAGELGIPQVVLPGAVDMINFWAPETVPERFRKRCAYEHSKGLVTLIRATGEELYAVGKLMAERLNDARGPAAIVFPLRGFSIIDNDPSAKPKNAPPGAYCQEMVEENGKIVFKSTSKPWHDPSADLQLLKALVEHLDLSNPNLDLIVVDYNINDPEVAMLSAKLLASMIKGVWRKGWLPEVPDLDASRIVKDPKGILRERL